MTQMCTTPLYLHSHRMQNHISFFSIFQVYSIFGGRLSILTVIHAIKEPTVMRHMNTEVALLTAAAEQRLAQHGGCDCHHSVLVFHVAVRDGGV